MYRKGEEKKLRPSGGTMLSLGTMEGLSVLRRYRFLTREQMARIGGYTVHHAGEVLRSLERRGFLGAFGYDSIPGQGRTPKVYYLKRKGIELVSEFQNTEHSVSYSEIQDAIWTPQMYHRLRTIDLFISLELQLPQFPHVALVDTFLEYRRLKSSQQRETTDFVDSDQRSENKLVPDGAFILENQETGNLGLFFVEMDMGSERVTTRNKYEYRQTVHYKLRQYDRYLTSGNFAQKYADYGEFRLFTLLFVTYGRERIENIRRLTSDLADQLHAYYRFATFEDVQTNFLGSIWKSRRASDQLSYPLVQPKA